MIRKCVTVCSWILISNIAIVLCIDMASQVENMKLKKNQKSLGCQLFHYWFCLDCTHVFVRLYDALKNEPTKNVPFYCHGCTRILPKLSEIGNVLSKQNELIDCCEKKIGDFKATVEIVVQEKLRMLFRNLRKGGTENAIS